MLTKKLPTNKFTEWLFFSSTSRKQLFQLPTVLPQTRTFCRDISPNTEPFGFFRWGSRTNEAHCHCAFRGMCESQNLWPTRWTYSCYLPIASDKRLPTCLSQVQMSSTAGRQSQQTHIIKLKRTFRQGMNRGIVSKEPGYDWPEELRTGFGNKLLVCRDLQLVQRENQARVSWWVQPSRNCVKTPLAHTPVSSRRQKWNIDL